MLKEISTSSVQPGSSFDIPKYQLCAQLKKKKFNHKIKQTKWNAYCSIQKILKEDTIE